MILFLVVLISRPTSRKVESELLVTTQISDIDTCHYKNFVIGDSQTPFVDWGSSSFSLISNQPGCSSLWLGGKTLNWLLESVRSYKTDPCVKNIAICIGTNGGFNKKDSISELITNLKMKFPNSNLYVIQGSWGWGGVKYKTKTDVKDYYSKFRELGVTIIEPPIGKIEPHGRKPIYKKIGQCLDSLVKLN